ncbi:MAG TPA: hypothetical protein PKV16_04275 [Caldisericia bacterium]|nr:hypothetical protein [Caldisericia bacterium]HPF48525.1 hypothetical protein [Caldisericia bacterium]HPI84605.1 hypothetical protein [Caldisericia bacterium]HPQ92980.1 hypothetical protein [Caldisericia bacterium]HRV75186.1 hypothetical protein [Caldisericia bacterium]
MKNLLTPTPLLLKEERGKLKRQLASFWVGKGIDRNQPTKKGGRRIGLAGTLFGKPT